MGIRIGVSLGAGGSAAEFAAAVDLLEASRIDSLWLPETVYGPAIDPFTGMAFTVGRTSHLKVGTGISVLPGRHPVLVAKQLTSLAGLAPGRILPAFGLQPATPGERQLFPAPEGQRGAVFDEALTLLRLMLTEPAVTFHGTYFSVEDASAGPLPAKPLDLWLGGSAPAGLRRVGRLADGWLGSFLTPAEAGRAVATINTAADQAGRQVEQDHFGLSLAVTFGGIPDALAASIRRRRPDADPAALIPDGWAEARNRIQSLADAGLSKFVVRPATPGVPLEEFIAGFTTELLPLQT
jgi:probable F420-dependent oxidoreductase